MRRLLLLLTVFCGVIEAGEPSRADYKSPYSVKFTFKEEDLIGDLLDGPRGNWKEQSTAEYHQWSLPENMVRWGYRGPGARHFNAPAGISSKPPEWARERVIATALRYVGYSYQHHHVPDWDPPVAWPQDPNQKTPPGKGLDCSNFTAFIYDLAFGILPSGDVRRQSEQTEMPGPGPDHTTPVQRIELPSRLEEYDRVLRTGDLLFINNTGGALSHVVLWVGKIGHSPDGSSLILDSTGSGNFDCRGSEIPDGIQLRPFKANSWYFKQASHVLRVIAREPGTPLDGSRASIKPL